MIITVTDKNVRGEDVNETVEFPDGTPVDVMEQAIRETFELAPAPTFLEREAYRVDKGRAMIDVGKTFARAMDGQISDQEARSFSAQRNTRFTPDNDERFAADNWGEKFVGATTELAPYLLDSTMQSIAYGELGAAAASAAALASGVGVAAVPAANIGGRAVGQAFGAWQNASAVEGGMLYGDLLEAGVDRQTAIPFARAGGLLIGAVELLQVGQLFNRFMPAGVRYSRKEISRLMAQALTGKGGMRAMQKLGEVGTRTAKLATITTALEIGEEEVQEVIGLAAEAGAAAIQAAHDQSGYAGPDSAEVTERLTETLTQSLLGFPLLGLPGSVVASVRDVSRKSADLASLQAATAQLPQEQRDAVIEQLKAEGVPLQGMGPVTKAGAQSLTNELVELVQEAGRFDALKDFMDATQVQIDDADVQQLGFDNLTAMMMSVYDASRSLRASQQRTAAATASEQTLGDVQALVTTQADLEESRRRLGMTTETRLKQGRINELVSQQKRVAAQLDQAGRELKELGNLPELADSRNKIIERITELNKKFDLLDNDIAEIMNDPAVRIRDAETVQAKAGQELQAIEQAFEQGRLSSQEEVKAAQDRAIKVLEGSDLDAEDRAKFLRTIKNVQTAKQLAKALPVIRERIGKLSEAASRRTLKARLAKVLKQTQPRESAGKPRGKFTPEIQELLDVARAIVGMSKTQANEALQQSVETVRDGIPSPVEALRRRMLLVQAGAATSDEMAETVRLVETAIAQGRAAQDIMVQGRRQRAEVIIQEVVRIITGGAGVEAGAQTFGLKSREERVRELGLTAQFKMLITTGIDSVVGWMDLLDELSLKDKTSKPGESLISQVGDVFEQSLAEKRGLRLANEQLRRMAEQAYGITENKVLIATLSGNTAPVPLGRFKSANGVEAEWVLSKDQAIKKWMELQDPTLQETLTSEKGNAYTPEMREALEAFLTDKDKAFARAQLAFYQEYYQGVNEVYKRLHMINLPFNPHYSPIRREGVAVSTSQGFGDLLEEVEMRATMEGGSFKSRVKNVHPLAMTSSMAVLQQHIAAMERFKAWGDKIRDLNIIFKDAEVRQAIIEQYGQGMYDRLLGFLEDFTRGGVNKAKRIAAVDAFRINFTRAALAVRPVILIKQLVSFPAFAEAVPTGEFMAGVSEFVTDPLGKTAILKESEFFKSRGLDIDRDIKDAMRSDAYRAFRQQENFVNALMLNVQLGDQGAIAMGGWAVYRYARKQGQSHEEALMTFSRVANRTQQSGDLAEQSAFQRGGSVAKLFSMFQSAPNQYLRREIAALRNFRAGRMSGAQLAKTIAIYHFLLPMLFQLASDAFRWDEEEQLRAVILGPLNGLFIVGDMLDMVIRQVLEMRQFGLDVVPMASLMREVTTAVSLAPDAVMFNLSTEEVLEGIKALASVVGALRGVPLRAGVEMLESAGTLAGGDLRNGLFGLMGWTDFALEED